MCVELEAANVKWNFRQVFQIVTSMTRMYQPRLQCIGLSSEQLAKIWLKLHKSRQVERVGYCVDFYHDEEGNGTEQEYWEKEPPPLRSEVARAIHQTASRKATGPATSQQKCSKQERQQNAQNTCGDLRNWWVVRGMDVLYLHVHIPLPKKDDLKKCENWHRHDLVQGGTHITTRNLLSHIKWREIIH